MSSLLFCHVRVLTVDDAQTEHAVADVRVEGAVIAAIGRELAPLPGERVIEAQGKLLMPGLINGHFHSPGNFNKGALDDMPLELFMLYEVPPFDCPPTSPRLHYLRTLLGAAEMLKTGITAVHDDPFYVPVLTDDLTDATMQAYADSGMRATVSINMPNVVEYEKYPYLSDLLTEELRRRMRDATPLATAQLIDAYRHYIARWHGAEDGRLRAAVSCSAPQRVERDYLHALSAMAARFNLPYNMHILETRLQRVLGQERFGCSLVQYVHDEGVLDERAQVIHAIWVDEHDMELLAASGCSIAHNPLCNLKLGSGNAAKAMRLAKVTGQIAVGMQADMILLDLDTFAFTPLNDLRRQLVFCENGTSVRMVMVAGASLLRTAACSLSMKPHCARRFASSGPSTSSSSALWTTGRGRWSPSIAKCMSVPRVLKLGCLENLPMPSSRSRVEHFKSQTHYRSRIRPPLRSCPLASATNINANINSSAAIAATRGSRSKRVI